MKMIRRARFPNRTARTPSRRNPPTPWTQIVAV